VMNDNIAAYGTKYTGYVQMLPNETIMQITNCDETIAFGGNIKAELIDICGNLIQDITAYFYYVEVTDIYGVGQIKYEFGNLGDDYNFELLFLKLTHTVSEKIWYSAGFFITERNAAETDIFHYGNTSYYRGISYDKFDNIIFSPQIIRLQCFKGDSGYDRESDSEIQTSGRVTSSRSILSKTERHIFYLCDFFTYDRLVTLLNHEIIYMNGYRVSNKPEAEKGERWEDTNTFDASFTANTTEEKLPEIVHLFQYLELQGKIPLGSYSLSSIPDNITGTFNKPIDKTIGSVKIYKKVGIFNYYALFTTYTADDIIISGNSFTIDTSGLTFVNGDYYVNISEGLFISGTEVYSGIDNISSWTFKILNPDYDSSDYNSDDYFTN